MPALTLPEITANLRAVRASASADQVIEGRAWYPGMRRFIATVAAECADESGDYGLSLSLAVGVFAALSQNATWKANVTMATNYLSGRDQGMMASVRAEIDRMEAGEDPSTAIGALKRPDFYRNLMGDENAVTCDRWHLRAAYNGADKVKLTAQVRDLVTIATHIVAAEYDESPASCQAVIWCAVRPSGNGK